MRKLEKPELSLEEKAKRYDEYIASRSFAGKRSTAAFTAEQLSERGRKGAYARIQKYNQNMRKKIDGEF